MIKTENISLQEYLSLGYIYLVILGVLSDAIFYGILGVSYLEYTTILDALISPISLLMNNYKLAIILIVLCIVMFYYITKLNPIIYGKLRNKKWYQKIYNIEKWDKRHETLQDKKNIFIIMVALFFIYFIAIRSGMGVGFNERVREGDVKPNYTLVFKDNETINVRKIGQNSLYIFYVMENEKVITATPISENIKQIKKINKDE